MFVLGGRKATVKVITVFRLSFAAEEVGCKRLVERREKKGVKMNPCVIPTPAVDVVGDGRWESMVSENFN